VATTRRQENKAGQDAQCPRQCYAAWPGAGGIATNDRRGNHVARQRRNHRSLRVCAPEAIAANLSNARWRRPSGIAAVPPTDVANAIVAVVWAPPIAGVQNAASTAKRRRSGQIPRRDASFHWVFAAAFGRQAGL
jgi:hypothetical protein